MLLGPTRWDQVQDRPQWKWATVEQVAPLRISFNGQLLEGIEPQGATAGLTVGDRVWCQLEPGTGGSALQVIVLLAAPRQGRWQDWTPALLAGSTNPTMGDSLANGRYIRHADGTVHFAAFIRIGSTFSPGSGFYSMALPAPARQDLEWPVKVHITSIEVVKGIGDSFGSGKIEDGDMRTRLLFYDNDSTVSSLGRASGSSGWVAGDEIAVSGTYEAVAPSGKTALYVMPHQDDEILTTGAAILEDVKAGHSVYVAVMSRGDGSSARTSTGLVTDLGYTPSKEEFSAQRDKEFIETVRRLGAIPIVPSWGDRFSDGEGTGAHIKAWVLENFPSDTDLLLRATGPTDYHVDHQACGLAVESLAADGYGSEHRLYLSALRYVSHAPSGVTMTPQGRTTSVTASQAWPHKSIDIANGWWGIGYRSAKSSFDYLLGTDSRSFWHGPR